MSLDQTTSAPDREGWLTRLASRLDDGAVIRWAYHGLLAGAAVVVGLDAWDLYQSQEMLDPQSTGGTIFVEPALPPALRPSGAGASPVDPRRHVTLDDDALRAPLQFELRPGGILAASGSIDLGSAARFAEEIEARGEYVKTLSLNSPGGSVDDAMAIARLVRERGISTEVADGALCASSCPLLMAGGVTRSAGDQSAIGLHQFYAATDLSATGPAQAMSDAQATAARISRYLGEMGVEPVLWLHALDTPPQMLYYLSAEELEKYKLVTPAGVVAGG